MLLMADRSRRAACKDTTSMKVVMVGPYPEPGAQVAGGVERVIDTLLPVLARAVDLTLVVPGASC